MSAMMNPRSGWAEGVYPTPPDGPPQNTDPVPPSTPPRGQTRRYPHEGPYWPMSVAEAAGFDRDMSTNPSLTRREAARMRERVEREAQDGTLLRGTREGATGPDGAYPGEDTCVSPSSLTPDREAAIRQMMGRMGRLDDAGLYVADVLELLAALDEARQQIERLARERDAAQEIISELASDLEAEVNARYDGPENVYPSQRRRYERDMEAVQRARALLNQGDG